MTGYDVTFWSLFVVIPFLRPSPSEKDRRLTKRREKQKKITTGGEGVGAKMAEGKGGKTDKA